MVECVFNIYEALGGLLLKGLNIHVSLTNRCAAHKMPGTCSVL